MVYEPHEDSFLLLRQIKKFAKGNCLDMGTGSGILADEASKYCDNIIGVDIDEKAIEFCTKKYPKITFIKTDLFENLKQKKFDLITFNPPYLPDDSFEDISLFGGKDGYETIEKFLKQAKEHLNKNGVILLLFSSITKKEKVDFILHENGYYFEQIGNEKIFFEELYVYKIWKLGE